MPKRGESELIPANYASHSSIRTFYLNVYILIFYFKLASSTLKMEHSVVGLRLVQRLTTSRPMVITLQSVTEDSLPNNKVTIGSEDLKTDTLRMISLEKFKETVPPELLLPHSLR